MIVLSTYPGSFRLPNKAKLWLLRERQAFHLFRQKLVKESNFAPSVVFENIHEDCDFAGTYDETWAYFNSSIVNLEDEQFYETRFSVRCGAKHRNDEDLVAVVQHLDLEDFRVVEPKWSSYKIETGRNGEYVIDQEKYYEPADRVELSIKSG